MNRWFPSPLVSALLLLLWLLLNQSLEPAQWLLGAALALGVPVLAKALLLPLGYPRLARPTAILALMSMAFKEIILSCIGVARLILFAKRQTRNSRFIRIPLDLRNPYGLALLSCLINSTPGTVWVEILPERHELILHVFDMQDEQWWKNTIKLRYERPIIAIFEQDRLS